nr:mitotic spindle assembly checkpoint protein MAD1-like isoform X1 [Procambarus clarkii]
MDASPEPTFIAKAMKDFNQFLYSGNRSRDSCMSGSRRLNFSEAHSDCSSVMDNDSTDGFHNSKKRHLDSVAGFDITKKFREKDSEIIGAQAKISRLEGRIRDLEMTTKKAKLERDTELESLRRKQLGAKELIDDLQHKVKQLQTRERETQDSAHKTKKECNTTSLESEAKMIKMQQEYLQQCNRLHVEIRSLHDKVLNLEKEVDEKTSQAELAKSLAEELEEKLTASQNKLRELTSSQLQFETLKLELDQAKAKIKEVKVQQEELEMLKKKSDVFEATVRKMAILQKESAKLKDDNKFLRDTARNTELIDETLTSAQQQIKLLEKRCKENAHLQAENDLLKETVQQYESVAQEEFRLEHKATPQELQNHIIRLKRGDETLTKGITQLRASQKSLESSRASEEAEIKELKSNLQKQLFNTQQNAQLIKRLQRKLILVTKERDSLKSILSSYESEVTINHSVVSQEKITKLEDHLELYKRELQRLESELDTSSKLKIDETIIRQTREDESEKISSLEKKVVELKNEIAKLTQDKEILEVRLEHRALKGDYDPTKTKVLHFENNPLAKAVKNRETEIQRIQKENEALQERVRLLEDGEALNITEKVGIKLSDEAHSSRKVNELKEKIKSTEIRNKRLLEVFKRKSLEMREVVYRLTGYRVDVSGDNHYKLINMYAESADDFFMFEQTANKELQLLETDFSSTLDDLIDAYLRHENSYPAFLSAVTLDLFNRQTVEQPPSSSEVEEEEEEEDMEPESEEPKMSQPDDDDEYDDNDLVVLD